MRKLASLPHRATAILVIEPDVATDDLDWLNFFRPIIADRAFNLVLWCPDGGADVLAQRAPDFFDWVSVRVDCPPAPAAHAVAAVRAAICSRAVGIAWDGPGLEETLAAIRPGRPIHRVVVDSYQSMIDALAVRAPGWLYLDGIDTTFHLRRLRWAMAESWRRTIVLLPATVIAAPGWWTVNAMHLPIASAVRRLSAAGGSGRLAALTGLDAEACEHTRFAVSRGIAVARLESLLADALDPRIALRALAEHSGWTIMDVFAAPDPDVSSAEGLWKEIVAREIAIQAEDARRHRDRDLVVATLAAPDRAPSVWARFGVLAEDAGDSEVAIRSLERAVHDLDDDTCLAPWLIVLGRARAQLRDFERAYAALGRALALARTAGLQCVEADALVDFAAVLHAHGERRLAIERAEGAVAIVRLVATCSSFTRARAHRQLGLLRLDRGELKAARTHLEAAEFALNDSELTGAPDVRCLRLQANVWQDLAEVLLRQRHLDRAREYLERAFEGHVGLEEQNDIDVARAFYLRAQIRSASGDSLAAVDLDVALAILRRVPSPAKAQLMADVLRRLTVARCDRGRFQEAHEAIEESLAILTDMQATAGEPYALALRERAILVLAEGNVQQARRDYEQTLEALCHFFEVDDRPHERRAVEQHLAILRRSYADEHDLELAMTFELDLQEP